MATKLGDLTVGADGSWSSGPHTMTAGSKSVTLRRKSDGAVLVTRNFTVSASSSPVSYVGAGSIFRTAEGSGASDVAAPAGVQVNDILVVVGFDIVDTAGWTRVVSGTSAIQWLRATSTPANYAISTAFDEAGYPEGIRIYAFRGCPTTGSPIDVAVANASTGTGSSITGSALSQSANSMIVLASWFATSTNATAAGGSTDTLVAGGVGAPNVHLAYDSTPPGTSGAQTAPTMTFASSVTSWSAATFALKAA